MVVEHRGYTLQQSSYNNHYMIIKDNKMVCHAQYDKKLTKQEAKEKIDFYIDLSNGKIKLKDTRTQEEG